LDSGKETIPYDALILAPGGTPRRLPIEGANLDNVYTLRGIEDAKKVDAGMPSIVVAMFCWRLIYFFLIAAQEGKNVVVIGSSFISMELVIAMSSRKLASIHVVGTQEFPFQTVLGKEVGQGLMKVSSFFPSDYLQCLQYPFFNISIMNPRA
jgi:NADPH-dependent 2,4-dienoyl-CoA reductase/sulfur reductase-like enzyme